MTVSFWLIAAVATWLSYYFFSPPPKTRRRHIPRSQHLPSAVIPSYTSHARILPVPAKNAFSYPLIYVGVDIDALESGALDLPHRLLVHGGSPWSKIMGLRPDGYLKLGTQSLRSKLNSLLEEHGLDLSNVGKAWLITMPSFLGFEGINPLSVWYVYDRKGGLLACVLEVHNTFHEKHAYVLRVDSPHRHDPKPGHDYAWTFPRTFHVSPFNSRNGYYHLDLIDPFPIHTTPSDRPQFKISLRLLTPAKKVKLTAVLASHPIHRSIPLDAKYTSQIVRAIARWPLALFLSTPRILYHAWQLHYDKKLAVFPRPEPRQEGQEGSWNPPQNYADEVSTPVRWQVTSLAEKISRSVVSQWAKTRAVETSIQLEVVYHRSDSALIFPTLPCLSSVATLRIQTSSPKIFSQLLIAPTPDHFLILAPELLTTISDPALFRQFFNPNPSNLPSRILDKWIQSAQARYFLWQSSCSFIAPPPHLLIRPDRHYTSSGLSVLQKVRVLFVIWLAFFGDWLEEGLMRLMRARWVPGGDPQRIWERALRRQYKTANRDVSGAKDSENSAAEGWEEVGSLLYCS